jgi:hypothetical protein
VQLLRANPSAYGIQLVYALAQLMRDCRVGCGGKRLGIRPFGLGHLLLQRGVVVAG